MHTLILLLSLAGAAPAAGRDDFADPLPAFARECPAGKPKKRNYDDATFAAAVAALRTRTDVVPRAWAVTCERVTLCSRQVWGGDTCPRTYVYGQPPGPQGNPANGGELMVLVEPDWEKPGNALYAMRAKSVGSKWGIYHGWALPSMRIAVIEGPAFEK